MQKLRANTVTSKAEKLLEKMRQSKSNWKRKDIETLYLGFGFIIKAGRNHDIVKHPEFPELRQTLPRHKKLAKGYVKDAVNLVDDLLRLREEHKVDDNGTD